MLSDIVGRQIARYFEVATQFPELFKETDTLRIIADKDKMVSFQAKTGRLVGVVYESPYHLIVVDLMENAKGEYYTYLRILNPNGYRSGVVVIPFCKNKIALLRQFRHGTRQWEWELPRGFSEPNLTAKETAIQEIYEELGADVASIQPEGTIVSDSALSGGMVYIFSVQIESIKTLAAEEGISAFRWISLSEMKKMIVSNDIKDSFTICAISKYIMNQEGG